jgi:hypothetical protein
MFKIVILSQAKRVAAAVAAVGAIAATPALAVDFDATTAPLPTDQRVSAAPNVRAVGAQAANASVARAAAVLPFDGISGIAALPTDQRVSGTSNERASTQRRVPAPAAVTNGRVYVSAPLPTDVAI